MQLSRDGRARVSLTSSLLELELSSSLSMAVSLVYLSSFGSTHCPPARKLAVTRRWSGLKSAQRRV